MILVNGEPYVHARDRDAFKVLIVTSCVVYAALALPFYEKLGSPSLKAFPTGVALTYLAFLFVFGMISLVGIFRLHSRIEGIGMFGLSGIWLCFGIMGLNNAGPRATAFASFLFAFAAAAGWTWWQRIGRPWRAGRRRRRGAE